MAGKLSKSMRSGLEDLGSANDGIEYAAEKEVKKVVSVILYRE